MRDLGVADGRRLALLSDLIRVETRLYNAVDDRLRAELDTGIGRYEVLDCIDGRDRCRVLDVADTIAITIGAASKAVDRVEAAGLCVRTVDPDDRRSSLLSLTTDGRQLLTSARKVVVDELRNRLEPVLSDAMQSDLSVALATLLQSLQRDAATGGSGRRVR